MIEVTGHTGQVSFDGEHVTITRAGFPASTSVGKGHKRLHVGQITAVQWKPAGPMVYGFIQFTVPGVNDRRPVVASPASRAAHDENAVIFTRRQMPAFGRLRAAVDEAISSRHARHGGAGGDGSGDASADRPGDASADRPGAGSADGELAKLASLRDEGVITAADFEIVKTRLLGTR